MHRLLLVLFTLSGAEGLLAAPAAAQPAAPDTTLPAVTVTAARVPLPTRDAPARVTVLDREAMGATGAVSVADLLERRAPLFVRRYGPSGLATVSLRQLARRIADLTVERAREKNRLHAARASRTTSPVIVNDIEVNLRHLQRHIAATRCRGEMVRQALKVVAASTRLSKAYGHLTSVRGIAEKSAVELLGELLCLPEGMSVREWVAYAGLDVRKHRSGRSVEERPRISKEGNVHVRRSLYMPALVAVRREPAVGAFYDRLVGEGKAKMVAVVAVMRKLLHAIYGMLKHDADFDGALCFQAVPAGA